MNKSFLFAFLITVLLSFTSCNKTAPVITYPLSDYNLQTPGKYIIYQLDSLTYANNGNPQTTSYFAKDSVDAEVTDNLGRPAFRILHFLSNSQTGPWQPNNTFLTVPLGNTIEYIENNLRYIKLHEPIENGYTWPGNSYIDTYDVNIAVPNINDWDLSYLDGWNYTYQNVNQPLTLSNLIALDSTLTVNESDTTIGDTSDNTVYSETEISIEQYAKGIGLVSRNFLHREYQPPVPNSSIPGYFTSDSYGVTLTMVEHN
jgi:hypothetical protein